VAAGRATQGNKRSDAWDFLGRRTGPNFGGGKNDPGLWRKKKKGGGQRGGRREKRPKRKKKGLIQIMEAAECVDSNSKKRGKTVGTAWEWAFTQQKNSEKNQRELPVI